MKKRSNLSLLFKSALILVIMITNVETALTENATKKSYSLSDILVQALVKSKLVKEIDSALASRLADAIEVSLLPNPSLDADLRQPQRSGDVSSDTEIEISLEQPFRLSHFGLRDTVAELISNSANMEQKLAVLKFTQDVKLAYASVWAVEEKIANTLATKLRAEKIANLILDSASKGLLPKSEARLFQAQAKKLSADLIGLNAEANKTRAELTRISGVLLENTKLLKPEVEISISEKELIESYTSGKIPLQQRSKLLRELATEQRKLAEKDSFPLLSPRLIYQHTSDGFEQFGVGIKVELPIFNKNQVEKNKRSADEITAFAEEQYLLSESFQSELKLSYQSLRSAKAQAKSYQDEVIPILNQALASSEQQLRAGQGSVLIVFQAQRELNEVSSQAIELWIKALVEQIQLSILLGKEI